VRRLRARTLIKNNRQFLAKAAGTLVLFFRKPDRSAVVFAWAGWRPASALTTGNDTERSGGASEWGRNPQTSCLKGEAKPRVSKDAPGGAARSAFAGAPFEAPFGAPQGEVVGSCKVYGSRSCAGAASSTLGYVNPRGERPSKLLRGALRHEAVGSEVTR
jgi:hypothetical protein